MNSNGNLTAGELVMVYHLGLWINAVFIRMEDNGDYRVRIGRDYVPVKTINRRRLALRVEEKLRQKELTKEKRNYGRAY